MAYWILKSDPETYSWQDLMKDGKTTWDGIRNYQARLNLRAMKPGDLAYIYHSQTDKEIVGVARIVSTPKPDPKDEEWTAIDIAAMHACKHAVSLEQMKRDAALQDIPLIKHTRLSVIPITSAHAKRIDKLGGI